MSLPRALLDTDTLSAVMRGAPLTHAAGRRGLEVAAASGYLPPRDRNGSPPKPNTRLPGLYFPGGRKGTSRQNHGEPGDIRW